MHLFIVTLGIEIALSLEGLLEWRHHRGVGGWGPGQYRQRNSGQREGRRPISEGSSGNSEESDGRPWRYPGDAHARENECHFASTGFDTGGTWQYKLDGGALEFIPCAEVKEYAGVYPLQDEYLRLQTRTEDSVVSALAMFSENRDPNSLPRAGLEVERDRILNSLTTMTAESQIAEVLDKRYKEILKQVQIPANGFRIVTPAIEDP